MPWIKLPRMWKMQLDGIIVKYCTDMLINSEGVVNLDFVTVKDRNGATISDKERVKERWAEHFENLLNRDRVAGKDIEENEKVCDTLDVKEDLFCEEELATVLKGLKIKGPRC